MTQPAGPPPTSGTGGGSFTVDITRAPQAIRELEQALAELRSVRREAVSLAQVQLPAQDQVTVDAAIAMGRAADGQDQSFVRALDAGISELDNMIGSLRRGFETYQRGDHAVEAEYRQLS